LKWDRNHNRQIGINSDVEAISNLASLSRTTNRNDIFSAILQISRNIQYYDANSRTDGSLNRFFSSSLPLVLGHIIGDTITNNIKDLRDLALQMKQQWLKGGAPLRRHKADLTNSIIWHLQSLEMLKNAAFSEQVLIADIIPSFNETANYFEGVVNRLHAADLITQYRKIRSLLYASMSMPFTGENFTFDTWNDKYLALIADIDAIEINWKITQSECEVVLNQFISQQKIDPLTSISFVLGDMLEQVSNKNTDNLNQSVSNYFLNEIARIAPLEIVPESFYAKYQWNPDSEIKTIIEGSSFKAITNPEQEIYLSNTDNIPLNDQIILQQKKVLFSDKIQNDTSKDNISLDISYPSKFKLERLLTLENPTFSPFYFQVKSSLLGIEGNVVRWKIGFTFSELSTTQHILNILDSQSDIKRSFQDDTFPSILKYWLKDAMGIEYFGFESPDIPIAFQKNRTSIEVSYIENIGFHCAWTMLLDTDDQRPMVDEKGFVKIRFKILNDYQYIYHFFSNNPPLDCKIEASVIDLHNVEIYNDYGKLDTNTPFNVFGNKPEIGSKFYIGHPLLFTNSLTNLKINWQWFGLTDAAKGLIDQYDGYDLIEKNTDFIVTVSALQSGTWFPESDKQIIPLFTDSSDSENEYSPVSNIRRINEIDISRLGLQKSQKTYELLKEPNKSKYGYLCLELYNPTGAFGHNKYNDFLQKKLSTAKSKENLLEPYTPLAGNLTVEAILSEDIPQNQLKSRIEIFGIDNYLLDLPAFASNHLMPTDNFKCAVYLQFDKLQDGMAHLFFKLPESANGNLVAGEKQWNQLINNQWHKISQDQIIKDETLQFESSGLVLLNQLQNHEDPFEPSWLKICSFQDDSLNRISEIHTQVMHLFVNDTRELTEISVIEGVEIPENLLETVAIISPLNFKKIRPIPNLGFKSGLFSFQFKTQNRISDLQDLRQFLLIKFPKIQDALLIANKDQNEYVKAGLVRVVLIPTSEKESLFEGNWPKFSSQELKIVQLFLEENSPIGSTYMIENPVFEELIIKCNIVVKAGFDKNEARKLINQAILSGFLNITGIANSGFSFGKSIYSSKLLSLIKILPFIESITNFACYTKYDDNLKLPLEFNSLNYLVEPTAINHLLIPSTNHLFDIRETNKHNSDGIGVSNMTLGTDFLIEKLRSKQYKMGIGNFKIGINLQIDKPEISKKSDTDEIFI
jgi:hypothetical protein